MRIHVSLSVDDRYVPHSAAAISSLLDQRGEHELTVHYLHDASVGGHAVELIRSMVDGRGGVLEPIEIPADRVEGLPAWDYITSTMWFRIFLPELLPRVDRVLYLDVDTIALAPIEKVFTSELEGKQVGAVANVFQPDHLGRLTKLGFDDPRDYFNSGVLLMDLVELRRDGCSQALFEFARENAGGLLWPDQDTLNLVLKDRWKRLHPRWNAMTSTFIWPWGVYAYGAKALNEARANPGIRHFEGPGVNKPWHFLSEVPLGDAYFAHRGRTPWPRTTLTERTLRNRARRIARPYVRRLRAKVRP